MELILEDLDLKLQNLINKIRKKGIEMGHKKEIVLLKILKMEILKIVKKI